MFGFDRNWLEMAVLLAPPLLLSLTLHEFAHARVALAFGDPTAYRQGRVTLNPMRHLDPIGTLMILSSFGFGWARPVPVNPYLLRNPPWGDIAVSLAGVGANLGIALFCGVAIRLLLWLSPQSLDAMDAMVWNILYYTLTANICLIVFNLLPIFPLDGHHVAVYFLPREKRDGFMNFQQRFGMWILLGLVFLPRILPANNGATPPDPLGWLFGHVLRAAETVLMYGSGYELVPTT